MIVAVQRVLEAEVTVSGESTGKIRKGLLLLVGIDENDSENDAEWLVHKILNLRIFSDEAGKMNLSVSDITGEILCVSQFTLIADYKKGNRPGFTRSAKPEQAIPLYEYFLKKIGESGLTVQKGIFGANMQIALINDGPVTLVLNSQTKN